MAIGATTQIYARELTFEHLIDKEGVDDKDLSPIKGMRKLSDGRGGVNGMVIYTFNRDRYTYHPNEKITIRIKLTDLLNGL
jgi:hypothetical protein